jgi:predicted  nucleic acid-binding Zn-ribbon protein
MIEFIAGMLCLGMAIMMLLTARLLNRISNLEEQITDLNSAIANVYRDVNMVEHTIMNRIDNVDKTHTRVEDELKEIITGSMKSSNKRLLKG